MLKECNSLFQAVRHYGFERGRVNIVLNFQGPIEKMKPSIEFLHQHGTDGDSDLNKALKNLTLLSRYKDQPIIAQITTTQQEIKRLRAQYDQQFLVPFQTRDSELDDLWFTTMSQQIKQINSLIFMIMKKTDWSEGQKNLAEAYYTLAQLRDQAGPVGAYLKAAAFNVKSLTSVRIEEIKNRKGIAEDYLDKFTFFALEVLDSESFTALMEFKHLYFDILYPFSQIYIESVQSETLPPQLESTYKAGMVIALEKLNTIGETLERTCTAFSTRELAVQRTNLLFGYVASISAFLIIFYCIYLLYRRMYVRIISSANTMEQLTHGNLSVDIKPSLFPDEIGYIENGLETFRQNLQAIVNSNVKLHREIEERIKAETEKEYLESQLRQKHKMEAIGHMAGGIAHNFNNNLAIILGNVELVQMKQPPESENITLLENAKIAIRRSRDLVKQINTYSQKGFQKKSALQLSTIVADTINLLKATQPATVNFSQECSVEGCAVFILADALQLQDVLVNLAKNAVRAMDGKGDVKISLETIELQKKDIPAQYNGEAGHYAQLSIQDTGCGMPADMLDKIFDPFFTTKEEYEGAGMGLATVQGVVAQHGGSIKVASVPGQGTVFTLYFPIVTP
jgi:signal transduction histidine kinase